MDTIFYKTPETSFLGLFEPSTHINLNFFSKIKIRYFSYFMMFNIMEKKKNKTDDPETLHGRRIKRQSQIYRTLLLGWVSN